jgi:hypothetical protein
LGLYVYIVGNIKVKVVLLYREYTPYYARNKREIERVRAARGAGPRTGKRQRGDTEAQNGYVFCMLLGQVAVTDRFQAQLCYVDSNAAELETCKLWPPASAAVA